MLGNKLRKLAFHVSVALDFVRSIQLLNDVRGLLRRRVDQFLFPDNVQDRVLQLTDVRPIQYVELFVIRSQN